ncbi:DMT family transporter [Brevibacillus centrosporus]|jgi:drug/metabolite transporter (DMT)-like permease|uniref:Threonine/homoserine efflux transporter RhtA n=1 Tax=Brevibacillus centrosporus TaxID=54910 RepID=A0A1I3QXW7_9BACL|nr:DMT family transporter [Brevibacillus centrosporus]MEC2129548.1 DMT family transporter [Brevibacillus centrosporus]MED4908975.1 DMT family transporter [Brevibacillus centrosporus]RNB65463.1 DMT family transporter [Brevibacillus centrosporus]SFJ38329.1 Threonine/homoserine efflux transporter RhtA [Brevibacillus centrosporus]GED29902.1 transporter [Brevibacillus centrosporus]
MKPIYAALLLCTSFLWGGNFVVGKFLVGHASSLTLTDLRWMIAVVFLIPMVWFREKRILPTKQAVLPLILMGVTGVALFNLFMFWALERTNATNVGLLSTLNPVSIAIFSFLLVKDKIKPLQIVAMFISFGGVLVVMSKGDLSHISNLHFNVGDLWMLAAVAMWGIYSVCARWAMKTVTPLMSTLYSGVFGVALMLPFNLSTFTVQNTTWSFWLSLFYVGVLATVVSMVMWNVGVQKVGATAAGMFLNFNPVFTAILAFLLLGERMTATQLLGSVIVIIGCYLFSRLKNVSLKRKSGMTQAEI